MSETETYMEAAERGEAEQTVISESEKSKTNNLTRFALKRKK